MSGIKDIAKRARVSISTVSYALNGSDKVSDKTRDRIIQIAEDLNYTPNLAGQTLKKKKTNIIGVYVSDFGGYFYSHIIDGISKRLKQDNYETIICSGGRQARLFLPQKLIDGAIIIDPNFPDKDIENYAQHGQKIVLMRAGAKKGTVSHVLVDNRAGSFQAIDRLLDLSLDKIILVTGPSDSFDSQQRLTFSLARLSERNFLNFEVVQSDFTIAGGKLVASKISVQGDERIGVFCFNDEMAVGLYDLFQQSWAKPDTLKIIGFDNDDIGSYLQPGLSTINYSKHKWGAEAADSLISMLDQNQILDKLVQTELLEKGSSN